MRHRLDHPVGQRVVVRPEALLRDAELVGVGHVVAPAVEGAHLHPLVQPPLPHQRVDARRQRPVVAKHQDRPVRPRRGGELLGAVDQDHRLARPRHAVDDPVPLAHRARELLLLQVHHQHQRLARRRRHRGPRPARVVVIQQRGLRLQPDLGEEVPADAVALRQGQRRLQAELHREHAPQPRLESGGVQLLGQILAGQRVGRREELVPVRIGDALALDVGEHHAAAPGHGQIALVAPLGLAQAGIALHLVDQLDRVAARLQAGVDPAHPPLPVRQVQLDIVARDLVQRAGPPALDLQHQQAAARMQHHEVRQAALVAHGNVVPDEVVVLQTALELPQHAPLGAPVLRVAATRRDILVSLRKDGHVCTPEA